MKSRGLGDSIEKITETTGLKTLMDIATKAVGIEDCGCGKRRDTLKTLMDIATKAIGIEDCGCDKRKAWLNKQFPYKYK